MNYLLENPLYLAEDRLMFQETCKQLKEALGQLSPLKQKILVLRFGDIPLSWKEISRELGFSVDKVRTQGHYALKELRKLLRERI